MKWNPWPHYFLIDLQHTNPNTSKTCTLASQRPLRDRNSSGISPQHKYSITEQTWSKSCQSTNVIYTYSISHVACMSLIGHRCHQLGSKEKTFHGCAVAQPAWISILRIIWHLAGPMRLWPVMLCYFWTIHIIQLSKANKSMCGLPEVSLWSWCKCA